MNIEPKVFQKQIKVGRDLVVIDGVNGEDFLYRVMVNEDFIGHIQKQDSLFYKIDGCNIHPLLFAKICQVLGN